MQSNRTTIMNINLIYIDMPANTTQTKNSSTSEVCKNTKTGMHFKRDQLYNTISTHTHAHTHTHACTQKAKP